MATSGPARADSGDANSSDNQGTPTTPSRSGSGNLADAQDDPVSTCAILLPKSYAMKEGEPLWGGVKLGRLLGAGVQAKVYELEHNNGRPTGKVLKISHTDLGHKLLNNPVIWIGMEREWEIGTQLRAALEVQGGQLPGFMRMCDCVVRSSDEGGEGGKAAFSGMIMEKLNGWEVYKRVDTPEFHNIHYVREMLFQVFSALDRAQRKLGFHHADLGMRNVMEHYPRLWEEVQDSQAAKSRAAETGAATSDTGAGRGAEAYEVAPGALPGEAARQATGNPAAAVVEPAAGKAAGPGDSRAAGEQPGQRVVADRVPGEAAAVPEGKQKQPWWKGGKGAGGKCGMVRPKPGFSCNADGSRLPLGPNVEVIDFGLAAFDPRLAAAAGGYESEDVMQHLNTVFAARHITFGTDKSRNFEMATSESNKKTWHLLPTGMKNRFRVKQTPVGAAPISSAASIERAGLPPMGAATSGVQQLQPVAEVDLGSADELPQRYRSTTLLRRPGEGLPHATELTRSGEGTQGAGGELSGGSVVHRNPQRSDTQPLTFKQSPIEKMYRVWPKQDERDVQLFISLVHHVTGVRMRASFASEGQGASVGLFGRLACGGRSRVKEEDDESKASGKRKEYGSRGNWHHWFRRMHIRWSAHMTPYNSGLLAGEALVSPFFGAGRVQHAKEGPKQLTGMSGFGAAPSPVAAVAAGAGAVATKRHHLLKYELNAAIVEAARDHFGGVSPEEAGEAVWELQQRELRDLFIKVYKTKTVSCNNKWMRGKLLLAIGLDTRWEPAWMRQQAAQAGHQQTVPPTGLGDGVPSTACGPTGRPLRRAAAAAPQRWGDSDGEDSAAEPGGGAADGSDVEDDSKPGRRAAPRKRGAAGAASCGVGGKRVRQGISAGSQEPAVSGVRGAGPAPGQQQQSATLVSTPQAFAELHAALGGSSGLPGQAHMQAPMGAGGLLAGDRAAALATLPPWLQQHIETALADQAAVQQQQQQLQALARLGLPPASAAAAVAASAAAVSAGQPAVQWPQDGAAGVMSALAAQQEQQWAATSLAPPALHPALAQLQPALFQQPALAVAAAAPPGNWGQQQLWQQASAGLQPWGTQQQPVQQTMASVQAWLQQHQQPPGLWAGQQTGVAAPSSLNELSSAGLLAALLHQQQQQQQQQQLYTQQLYGQQQQQQFGQQQQQQQPTAGTVHRPVAAGGTPPLFPAPQQHAASAPAGSGQAQQQHLGAVQPSSGQAFAHAARPQACNLSTACGPRQVHASPFAGDAMDGAGAGQPSPPSAPANPYAAAAAGQAVASRGGTPVDVKADGGVAAAGRTLPAPSLGLLPKLPSMAQLSFGVHGLPSLSLTNGSLPSVSQDLQSLFQAWEEGRVSMSLGGTQHGLPLTTASALNMAQSQRGSSHDSLQACWGPHIERGKSLVKHLESDDITAISAILLPPGYRLREGAKLPWDGVRVGKMLGSGMQAQVFQLTREDGRPTGKVIKLNHNHIGSKLLNNDVVWIGMHHEWRLGTQLRAALQQPDGTVPGFMVVADCVLPKDEGPTARARFGGMVMGELRGWEVYKRVDTPEFHNIHYVREMLFQVFSALDRAQRKLGFHHADLGMRNIMEHYPRTWDEVPGGEDARADMAAQPGYTSNADGSRLPLGPDVEFKIIDFGIAKLSERLAKAAGGRESEETLAQMEEMFGKGKTLVFSHERKNASIEMETGADSDSDSDIARPTSWLKRMLRRQKSSPKINVRMACFTGANSKPGGSRPGGSRVAAAGGPEPRWSGSSAGDDDDEEIRRPERFAAHSLPKELCPGKASDRSSMAPHLGRCRRVGAVGPADRPASARCPACHAAAHMKHAMRKKKKSPIETIYRHFWHRKGDVFHLLLGIALALDNRVWPEEDEEAVEGLVSLVHHVTGIRMKASFAELDEGQQTGPFGLAGHLACFSRPQVSGEDGEGVPGTGGSDGREFGRQGKLQGFGHWFKRWYFRVKAHTLPFNSGLLAGEALVHPFFRSQAGPVKHATVPAALEHMFPASGGRSAPSTPPAAAERLPARPSPQCVASIFFLALYERSVLSTCCNISNSTLVQHLEDEEDTATYAIVMPAEYQVKEGAQLWTGVRLGKFLGAGVQAKVFQLARDDGTPIGKVIKINHADIGSKILNNNVLWIGMDREWEIGTQLRAALQVPGGEVPGFMKVCDCLVARKGNQAAFSGMLMGELHGWEVYKRVDTPEFHNIHYVREMLFQTFSALDRAQRKLGFHHADLGMRNIMEHYPKIWEELSAEQGQQAEAEAKKFPGYSCTADGKRLPLGPQLEFKIIDFGVAKFSSKLAAAAAGSQAQEVVERLHEQRERIKFGSAHSRTSIEFEPSDVTEDETRMSKLRKIFKAPRNRLTVVINPVLKPMKQLVAHTRKDSSGQADASGSESKASHDGGDGNGDGNGNGNGGDAGSAAVEEYQPVRLAAFQKPGYLQAEGDVAASRNRLSASGKKGRRKKKKSPIETIYRHFWHRKGDVFHLLLGIALALDDRHQAAGYNCRGPAWVASLWPPQVAALVQALGHQAQGSHRAFQLRPAGPAEMELEGRWRDLDYLLNRQGNVVGPGFEPGPEIREFLQSDCRVLVVGAGGLGCELLKDLALSGFGCIDVIDMDTIDVSNLNRQFLFRMQDVGQSKANIAAQRIMQRISGVKVTPHHCMIQEKTLDFYEQFHVIVLGLDSLEARRYMNSVACSFLEYDEDGQPDLATVKPMIDGGTEGFKGHARVLIPGITPCFECTLWLFPPQTKFPLCTLAETPRSPAHCIEYAKIILWPKERPDDTFDADCEEHMRWMYDKALARASEFGIQGVTYQLTQGVVKNIIPAIASTNAIVAAQCTLEALKLVTMCSSGLNNYMMYSGTDGVYTLTTPYERDDKCPICSAGVSFEAAPSTTLQQLIDMLMKDPDLGKHLSAPSPISELVDGDGSVIHINDRQLVSGAAQVRPKQRRDGLLSCCGSCVMLWLTSTGSQLIVRAMSLKTFKPRWKDEEKVWALLVCTLSPHRPAIITMQLTDYEIERAERIRLNALRMAELGVADAAKAMVPTTVDATAVQAPPKKRSFQLVTVRVQARRSERSRNDVNYSERDLWKAEESLARAELRSRIVTVRRAKGAKGDGLVSKRVSDRDGWRPEMGLAGTEACDLCLEAALAYADSLANPALCKHLTRSMVSGGFWMEQPRGLRELIRTNDKCDISVHLPPGQEPPPGSEYLETAADGSKWWKMVWLPRKSGAGFSGGWRGFSLDHKLFPGDVLVVETMPGAQHATAGTGTRFSLTMHIFRALDYETASAKQTRLAQMEADAAADGRRAALEAEEQEAEEERETPAEGEKADEGTLEDRGVLQEVLQEQAAEDQETECPAVQAAAAELSVQSPQQASMQQAEVQAGRAVPCQIPCAKRSRQPTLQAVEVANPPKRQRAAPGQRAVLAAAGPSGSNAAGSRSVEQDSKPRTARKQAVVAVPRKRSSAPAKAGGRKEAEQNKEKQAVAAARQAARQEARAASKLAKQAARQEALAAKAAAKQAEAEGDREGSDEGAKVWYVHSIVGVRGKGKTRKYEIKWVGWKETTWEPASMLDQPLHTYKLGPGVVL
ncbi:NEDD8-activating enzyme E1 catalytic subunit [Chlorella vulgaris]